MSTATLTPTLTAPSNLARDTAIVFGRELRPVLRDPFSVVFSMIQPLVFLGLFAPLLGNVPGLSGGALQWFVPGIVVMSCLFGASMTGSNLLFEMQTGSHERTLVTPMRRSALLMGRALKEIVPVLVQAVIVIAVVVPFSFELHVAGTVVGLLMLSVFCVGLGSLSYALALAAKGADWIFWTVQQTFLFPILLLAGMLLPVDSAPGWLQTASRLNPLTYVVDAERALFAGSFDGSTVAAGFVAAAFVCALGLLVGGRAMRAAD
ncbi:ABC transporter permease [Nocardioides iriomotensis]|uniref:Transport permease protein n=1 Tax=Nocardioides iriomotensis TaxID=715784 RepID=A0A4Q5JC23_9ACTN|nr:ABC transporter permease [Nocardioides iriomotensis]RYU15599.1 ABC transporter permease [Nocardioides iriomotensis]